ncbi:hypothetical protein DPMN_166330 [Dreissena polymorpha]|uniref:Uncharacterized protein n=1 Tax=Dreissena polymorpha TaxID=45954 RepID=A0A9D4IXH6_DREPO|nr:hypothetical protein DPMN_166330 [Dreissena polymorpha]
MKKEHTCVMLKKDSSGTFELVSFGNEAMNDFMKLAQHKNDDFFFFRLFKTDIVAKDKLLYVKDNKQRDVEAQVVFSKVQ